MNAVAGVILFFLDVSFLFASVYLVSFVSFLMPIGQFAIVIVNLISFYAFRLYDLPRIKRTQNLLSNALLSVVVSGVLVVLIFFLQAGSRANLKKGAALRISPASCLSVSFSKACLKLNKKIAYQISCRWLRCRFRWRLLCEDCFLQR